jgi:hypothetical protein
MVGEMTQTTLEILRQQPDYVAVYRVHKALIGRTHKLVILGKFTNLVDRYASKRDLERASKRATDDGVALIGFMAKTLIVAVGGTVTPVADLSAAQAFLFDALPTTGMRR